MRRMLKLIVMVALCAFAGNAFAIDDIIDFIGLYGVKDIEEYNTRIAENPEDYEAYIFRAFDRLISLFDVQNDDWSVVNLAGDFGLTVNRQGGVGKHGYFGFAWMALQPLDKLLLKNESINKAYPIAVPILKDAIADFDAIPKNWTGSVKYNPEGSFMPMSFDYADVLICKAILYETLSFLNLMKGYNPPPDAAGLDGVDHEALEEARRLTVIAAKLLDDFAVAEKARIYDPAWPLHFFNLDTLAEDVIHDNAQKIADLPYWTSRFDICDGIEGCLFTKSEKRNQLYEWRPKIDMTFRNIFEGKLSTEDGTFPQFGVGKYSFNDTPVMDTLTDSTVCGTFPGMNKTDLEKYLVLIGFNEHLGYSPAAAPNATVAQYGVVYNLPEGAENNPENPAMFAADLQSEIALLNPTMAGCSFAGWTKDYETHDGKIPAGAAESLELTGRFAQVTPEGEKKQGTPENPWEIGQVNAADVKAWTDGAGKLTIAGTDKMKDFPIIEAPWYWVRDSITALEIKSGVTRLGVLAFYNCRGLTSVTIPSSVATIGQRAFLGCPLTRVIAMKETTNPSWPLEEVFGPPSQFKGVILVPNPSVDSYKEAVGWRDYADAIRGMTLVTLPPAVGCRYVVRDLSSGEAEIEPAEAGGTTYALPIGARVSIDVVVPGPGYVVTGDRPYVIDSVEWGMTLDESRLPRVLPPGSEQNPWAVGAGVEACTNGTGELTVSGTGVATSLPPTLDRGSITSAVIGDGVTGIGDGLFVKCRRLGTVTLGKDVKTIGENTFLFCLGLEKIEIQNPDIDTKALESAIHYHTAIKPDGSLYTIPSVSIEGYVEMLCGKKELTDPDWEELGPVGENPMSDYGDYRFFKVAIKKIEE